MPCGAVYGEWRRGQRKRWIRECPGTMCQRRASEKEPCALEFGWPRDIRTTSQERVLKRVVPLLAVGVAVGSIAAALTVAAVQSPAAVDPVRPDSVRSAPSEDESRNLPRLRLSAQHVQKVADAEADVFGGVTIDADANVVRVYLTDDSDAVRRRFIGARPAADFAFHAVEHSMRELRTIQARVDRDLHELASAGIDVTMIGVSEVSNIVEIGVRSLTEEERRHLVQKYGRVRPFEDDTTFVRL
ncbi:MAG TPA: hypothetical protein VNA14_14100 [Mycobacteriales bacterium]|nr:hypothetical protein [Mycobacteriales bacterium]